MNRKKENNILRTTVQAVSFAFHNGYVFGWTNKTIYSGANKAICVPGLNCYSCPSAIGACPIGSLQAMLDSGSFKASLYVIGFIAMIGMLCGRLVCGFLCPFGFIQDLLNKIPLFKKEKNMPGHKYLKYLRYVILVVFVLVLPSVVLNSAGKGQPWFCEWICPSGTLLGGIPHVLMNDSLKTGFRFFWKLAILVAVLVLSIKYFRPFCKYVCPLGTLYGLCNGVSTYRIKVDKDKCVGCSACQKACGMDIRVWEKPNSTECIRCGKCIATCPNQALSTTWSDACSNIGNIRLKTCERSVESNAKFKKIPFKVIVAILLFACSLFVLFLTGLSFSTEFKTGDVKDLMTAILYIPGKLSLMIMAVLMDIYAVRLVRYSSDTTKDRELLELSNVIVRLTLLLSVVLELILVELYVIGDVGLGSTDVLVNYIATPLAYVFRNIYCIAFILLPTLLSKFLLLHKIDKKKTQEEEAVV